ncbi:MAG TPA: protein phosphatase 2C domain-containing protein [Intrasporangium sp.]|uniref:PP2C family protein-serine/threonine phosphatase n=1 Tax=Intrasporangium sp. TaxID=1925024 RepID=UPI002D779819|nr:protein phosphatase 2C domain-containing protein [Intrasporangium sp.]HET7397509.1 protein phosphatase 2C domain-containing protein [Intrasporangium sp.]
MDEQAVVPEAGVATDVGRVRAHNEDSARAVGTVFVVADGMGGHAAGEVASAIAVDTLAELADRPSVRVEDVVRQVVEANHRILASAADHPEQEGMATTLTGLACVEVDGEPRWAVFNLGDSRVYQWSDGTLAQVSVDHSEVQELVDLGLLTPEEAAVHPARNIVTRSLGREPMGEVDVWLLQPASGARFLLCSDGLSNELSADELAAVLRECPDPGRAAAELVARAVAAGGRDNATAVVVNLP